MAFSKPTKLPEWASSSANIVEPSAGKKGDGWLTDEIPPSSYENWRVQNNWSWWRWLDEKITEGATNENLDVNATITILTGPLALTNATALAGFAKGTYPGVVGITGTQDWSSTDQEVGVLGLAGSGTTSGDFTDVGVLGTNGAMTVNVGGAGVIGHSTSGVGVGGLTSNADITGATISNVGVTGTDSNFTGTISNFGVAGYSSNKAGVLGMGGAGLLGGATIADCGLVGVGNVTIPSVSFSNRGVLGFGDIGGEFRGITTGDKGVKGQGGTGGGIGGIGVEAIGGVGGTATGGIGIDAIGGSGTSGTGGKGAKITGGASTSGIGGNGAEFFGGDTAAGALAAGNGINVLGGDNSSSGDGGNGILAVAGTSTSGESGFGAVLQGATPNSSSHAPLKLVPQTTPGGATTAHLQAGEMYYNSGTNQLEYFNGTVWKVIATV
jgi:hypothetical protein